MDWIVSNPPYLMDPNARLYRDGGGDRGCDLSIRIVRESLERLSYGGTLILYTGTPVVRGEAVFLKKLQSVGLEGFTFRYEEIDPDIFGEELDHAYYHDAERIAAVAVVLSKLPKTRAFPKHSITMASDLKLEMVHHRLAVFNRHRLQPHPSPEPDSCRQNFASECALHLQEFEMVESAREKITSTALQAPHDPDGFLSWFEDLKRIGPGQGDVLFPWLEAEANLDEMSWFLTQEMAGEAGFDDLVAMTQVKFPARSKLEMAKNYWDEMGRGNIKGLHGRLLQQVAEELKLRCSLESTVWESLALSNLMTALAVNRRYAYLSVGALGAVEMTAPTRVSHVDRGLKRLGVAASARRYFALHANLDVRHSEDWNREVILPLVRERPECAAAIAEGALLRLSFGARCFERYRREFGLSKEGRSDSPDERQHQMTFNGPRIPFF